MRLTEAKALFYKLRTEEGRIKPTFHILHHHKERQFTWDEIVFIIRETKGRLVINDKMPTSQKGTYLWESKDILGRYVEIGVSIEEDIIVIHTWRKI